jgi:hypothetical protein
LSPVTGNGREKDARVNKTTSTEHAAMWYREELDRIEFELLDVLRWHWARVGDQVIAHAVVETAGSVLDAIAREKPTARADMLQRIDDLRLYLSNSTTGDRLQ